MSHNGFRPLPVRFAACAWALLALAGMTALAWEPAAESSPDSSPRIDPAGLAGSLLLASDEVGEQAVEQFFRAAGGRRGQVVILRIDDSPVAKDATRRLLDAWEANRGSRLEVVRWDPEAAASKPRDASREQAVSDMKVSLKSATGVWLVSAGWETAGEGGANAAVRDELVAQLKAVIAREGVVAVQGPAAARVAQFTISTDAVAASKAKAGDAADDAGDSRPAETPADKAAPKAPAEPASAQDTGAQDTGAQDTGAQATGAQATGVQDNSAPAASPGTSATAGPAAAQPAREAAADQPLGLSQLPGWGLLPGVLAATGDTAAAAVSRGVQRCPDRVGISLNAGAALWVRGRGLRSVGEGEVQWHLGAGGGREAVAVTLGSDRYAADLTALRNAARGRSRSPFPPATVRAPRVDKGTLIIIGGGGMPKGIISRFVELAGGKEASLIVLPTASPDPIPPQRGIAELFRRSGAAKVTVLPGRTLDIVESEEYVTAFREATGIWFGGGRQWRFADAYLDTQVHELMHAVLQRGGVIMGSSAGASIQAEYLARANPLGNREIIAEGYERGLGFLPGAAVDQHFAQRNRFPDMTQLVDRYPQLLGIGIDEATALVVQGSVGEVVGRGAVHFYDRRKPVVADQPDYESVWDGGRYELEQRKLLELGKKPEPKPKSPEKP